MGRFEEFYLGEYNFHTLKKHPKCKTKIILEPVKDSIKFRLDLNE